MYHYETNVMNGKQCTKFLNFIDTYVGLDREKTEIDFDQYYVVVFEATQHEIDLCRMYERKAMN